MTETEVEEISAEEMTQTLERRIKVQERRKELFPPKLTKYDSSGNIRGYHKGKLAQ